MIPKNYPVIVQFEMKHGTLSYIALNRQSFIDICYELVEEEINTNLSMHYLSEYTSLENILQNEYNISMDTYLKIVGHSGQRLVMSKGELNDLLNEALIYNRHIHDANDVVAGKKPKELAAEIMTIMFPKTFKVIDPDVLS